MCRLQPLQRRDHFLAAGKRRPASIGTELAPAAEPHDDDAGQHRQNDLGDDGGDPEPDAVAALIFQDDAVDDMTDDTGKENPPFEFAVSFLEATHATSSDTVKACVSIKSCLDFQVNVESIQLLTTSGMYDVSNLEQCAADRSQLQSWIRGEDVSSSNKQVSKLGVELNSNDLAFFLTELSLPSNLSDIALGGIDTSKFIPKSGRLCNTGYSHAGKSIFYNLDVCY